MSRSDYFALLFSASSLHPTPTPPPPPPLPPPCFPTKPPFAFSLSLHPSVPPSKSQVPPWPVLKDQDEGTVKLENPLSLPLPSQYTSSLHAIITRRAFSTHATSTAISSLPAGPPNLPPPSPPPTPPNTVRGTTQRRAGRRAVMSVWGGGGGGGGGGEGGREDLTKK